MSALFEATALVVPFEKLRMTDVELVGGKNASLGEMISQLPEGVKVPTGFATTAHAFREFLAFEGLADRINAKLAALDIEDVRALAAVGAEIRAMVENQPFPADLQRAIAEAFATLSAGNPQASFAVRSSATAEDLPDASFAGQQETFLNVVGIDDVLRKMKEVFASLYNDRAISYRVHKGFEHDVVALSAGVQRMACRWCITPPSTCSMARAAAHIRRTRRPRRSAHMARPSSPAKPRSARPARST